MDCTLKLYKKPTNVPYPKPKPFPGVDDDWAEISDYKYSASRMGGAPTISATLKWPTCLDDEWTDDVFVEFRGEKYYIKNTPSSSYDNTSTMYTHSVEFVSERVVLDNVYFFDAVKVDGDESLSDNSEFSFSGDIHMLADRLNISLERSGVGGTLGYRVVVDDGIESESKLVQVSNQFVSDVLKSSYEIYNIPHYFVGKVIHFGNYEAFIETGLEYGADKSLMSIAKSNSNKRIINRITGNGSDRNIPYYYPNPTPEGYLRLDGASNSKYIITDPLKFCSKVKPDKPFTARVAELSMGAFNGVGDFTGFERVTTTESMNTISFKAPVGVSRITFNLDKTDGDGRMPEFLPIIFSGLKDVFVSGEMETSWPNQRKYTLSWYNDTQLKIDGLADILAALVRNANFTLCVNVSRGYQPVDIKVEVISATTDVFEIRNFVVETSRMATFTSELHVLGNRKSNVYLNPTFSLNGLTIPPPYASFSSGEVWANGSKVAIAYIKNDYIYCGKLSPGDYELHFVYEIQRSAISPTDVEVSYSNGEIVWWEYVGSGDELNLSKSGISLAAGATLNVGDTLIKRIEKRINTQTNLMPSIYRDTDGSERWYNAVDGEYTDENGVPIEFKNEYTSDHPREYIHEVEDIFPTIKGMLNKAEVRIDMFSEIAFDQYDNNEIYPEDYEDSNLAGKYKHPYFFAKLRRTDSMSKLRGFNLFDCAIEGETMKVSFTSGHVASCEFEIGVDEASRKNPVQVDENGDLVRDDEGNVVYTGAFQPSQQDTINNEVWIALKKEESTMGVMLPDTKNFIAPTPEDTFVILGIHLPEAYITAAEKKLEDELIKYMAENNEQKFTYSVKLSSVFLAENVGIFNSLNENSMVSLRYGSVEIRDLFVESYSYNMNSGSALPDVTLSLSDTIKITKPKRKVIDQAVSNTNAIAKDVDKRTTELRSQIQSSNAKSADIEQRVTELEKLSDKSAVTELKALIANNSEEIKYLSASLNQKVDKPAPTPKQSTIAVWGVNGLVDSSRKYISEDIADMNNGYAGAVPTCAQVSEFVSDSIENSHIGDLEDRVINGKKSIKTTSLYIVEGMIKDGSLIYALPTAPQQSLEYCDDIIATNRYVDSVAGSDVYVMDIKLSALSNDQDVAFDYASLESAINDGKIILIEGPLAPKEMFMVSASLQGDRIYMKVNNTTAYFWAAAYSNGDGTGTIRANEKLYKSYATEEYVTNVVGDINTLLETIIAG